MELRGHSEKLALVHALRNVDKDQQMVINNNLRACGDCHNFMKLVPAMEGRTLIVTDPNRVHVCRSDQCSCNEFC